MTGTPPIDAGLLPGTERAALLADGTLRERPIGVEEARTADELAVLSSVLSPLVIAWLVAGALVLQVAVELARHEEHAGGGRPV